MTQKDLLPKELFEHLTCLKKWYKDITVIQVQCINDKGVKHIKNGMTYYGWKDTGNTGWYNNYESYPVYKIIHPVLGPHKYDPKRFKLILYFKF